MPTDAAAHSRILALRDLCAVVADSLEMRNCERATSPCSEFGDVALLLRETCEILDRSLAIAAAFKNGRTPDAT